MNEHKMFPARAEVICIIFTKFGNYYAVHFPVTFVGNFLTIPHAVPRGSVNGGVYDCPRKVDVNGNWVVEYLLPGLIINMRPAPEFAE